MFGLLLRDPSRLHSGALILGSQTIKAVTISGTSRQGAPQFWLPDPHLQEELPLVDYQLQDIERVSQSLKSLKRLCAEGLQNVATAVTGSNVILHHSGRYQHQRERAGEPGSPGGRAAHPLPSTK